MRKIIASANISLDGVIANPQDWHFPYFNEKGQAFAKDQLFASDALLMGRETYQGFAEAWPNMTDEAGFADRMNGLPKYVVSTTLEKAEWNNSTIVSENVAERVAELKNEPGQDILMYGYGKVAHTLLRAGLLDEVRLWLTPVFAGNRNVDDLIYGDGQPAAFEHIDTVDLGSGALILSYRPAQ